MALRAGDTVHFVIPEPSVNAGTHIPARVTRILTNVLTLGETISLVAVAGRADDFKDHDGLAFAEDVVFGFFTDIAFDVEGSNNSWHYPEQV